MSISKKEIRKILGRKMGQLNDVIADIDQMLLRMDTEYFRVAIFGSARIEPESDDYKLVYDIAYHLALRGVDVVTGGGPGLMQAASKGAQDGSEKSRSIGLAIVLPFEKGGANVHLDVKREHRRFSSRLDDFMRSSNAAIVTPGGIGTLLELMFTWQLIQAQHIPPRPIILLGPGGMWDELVAWLYKWPVKHNLISQDDMNHIRLCKSSKDVMSNLEAAITGFESRRKAKK